MQKSKTIICHPSQFDERFHEWQEKATKEYRDSINQNNIYCHISQFKLIMDDISHDGENHYILYHENDGGVFNMPD